MFRTFQIEFCLHDGHSGAPVASYREQAFEIALGHREAFDNCRPKPEIPSLEA
jgi:hypothetical protein